MIANLPSNSSTRLIVDVVACARNNAATLGPVLAGLPVRLLRSVVVVDNASTDATAQVARDAGAIVLREPKVGHGAACQRAMAHLEVLPVPPDVVVFLPPDGSADPQEIPRLLEPIRTQNAELVIGVRERAGGGGARVGTRVVLRLMGAIYRHRFEDLGPFRAVRFAALVAMGMVDRGAGWDAEMQVKSVMLGLQVVEVPVTCRPTRRRQTRGREFVDKVGATGRSLFHIVRNATAR